MLQGIRKDRSESYQGDPWGGKGPARVIKYLPRTANWWKLEEVFSSPRLEV